MGHIERVGWIVQYHVIKELSMQYRTLVYEISVAIWVLDRVILGAVNLSVQ